MFCTSRRTWLCILLTLAAVYSCKAFTQQRSVLPYSQRTLLHAVAVDAPVVGPHLPINQDFPRLERVYSNPDVYVIRDFLDIDSCRDMMDQASSKTMAQSPVAYAGWTEDFKDLFELVAKGPAAWIALVGAWWQIKDSSAATQWALVQHSLQNYVVCMLLATAAIAAFTKSRADGLQELRTSTSTTLDNLETSVGARRFVQRAAQLFCATNDDDDDNNLLLQQEAGYFEAPTIIRYEAGQQLAPHFDANRASSVEDANRGGQTLATLLVYLNDVPAGGLTRFGRLPDGQNGNTLTVQPKAGDALLFFPADAAGRFDERTEHEGCPAVDEKWIARIWRHQGLVPPPFGLSASELARV